MLTQDFKEMLSTLSAEGVEYLLIGSYALAVYGTPRATLDMDVWVRPTRENAARVWSALARFGAPLRDVSAGDFERENLVYQIGAPPHRIDILTSIDGVDFAEAWSRRMTTRIDDVTVPVLAPADFVKNKRATGRHKDLADLETLGALNDPD